MSTRNCPTCGAEVAGTARFCPTCGGPVPDAASAAAGDAYIGKTIASKFYVQKLIGAGGMGKVYKAQHLSLDKPVCLKMLRKNLLEDPSVVARFQREARASSRLNHPNSISVIDFGQAEDGALYIAMEYLSGRDLQRLLVEEFPLTEQRICHIMAQALSALAEAHANGIIHRDLKPENIMIESRRDEADFVKVLDFGIAKIQDPSGGEGGPALTRAGLVCGTPEYMSPEQARGAVLDARSDVYAIGVILYQLVTGYLPFDADTPIGFVTKHLTEIPVAPRQKRKDVAISEAMEALIMRCLAKDVGPRPPSAEALRNELLSIGEALKASSRGAPAVGTQNFQPPAAVPLVTPAPGGSPPSVVVTGTAGFPAPVGTTGATPAVAAAPLPLPPSTSASVSAVPATGPSQVVALPHAGPSDPPKRSGSSIGIVIGIVAVLLLGGGVGGAWKAGLFGGATKDGTSGEHAVGSAPYLCEKGEFLLDAGKFDEALNYAENAQHVDATYAEAFRLEGNAQMGRGQARKAAKAYKEYLRLAPTASDADEIKAKMTALGGP